MKSFLIFFKENVLGEKTQYCASAAARTFVEIKRNTSSYYMKRKISEVLQSVENLQEWLENYFKEN